jgi:hypothetical protein
LNWLRTDQVPVFGWNTAMSSDPSPLKSPAIGM